MSDEVRRLSDELARDPSSLVFVPLGEALRRQAQLDLALKVTLRGLERHPYNADGHDLLARIAVDSGDLQRAHDEWDITLRLAPDHVGARKGMGFVCFSQGRLPEAESHLAAALVSAPEDTSIAGALANVRALLAPADDGAGLEGAALNGASANGAGHHVRGEPAPVDRLAEAARASASVRLSGDVPAVPAVAADDPRYLFVDLLIHADQTALLLDAAGLVLAGAYVGVRGEDVSQEIGAALSGVSDEAVRATRHLDIGEWSSIVFETEVASVSMAPTLDDGLVMLATGVGTPLGLARRLLDRCRGRARQWLEREGAG